MKTTPSKYESLVNNRTRWILTLVSLIFTYLYMIIGSVYGNKKNASEENKSLALLLNPKAHGYNKIIKDPNSPSLWNSRDPKEWILLTIILILFPLFFFLFKRQDPKDPIWLLIVKTTVSWLFVSFPLLLLPINPFHKRILYNFKVVLARVVEQPAKELFMAFIFIVLFPLPGGENKTVATRLVWMAMKLGIFYIFQNLLLGAPKYDINKDPDKEKIIYTNKTATGYYIALILGIILIVIFEKYLNKKYKKTI